VYKILHVDDSRDDYILASRQLKKISREIEIDWADSGGSALELIEKNDYNCILSDFQMPGMDGLTLLKELRSQGRKIPFIFFTGQGNEEIAARALRRGADDYYTKEVGFAHYDRLYNSIKRSIEAYSQKLKQMEAERALQESERKYRTLVERASDSIIIIQDEVVKYINPRLPQVVGYTLEEVLEQPFIKFVHPDEHQKVISYYARRFTGDDSIVNYETRLIHKDGHILDVEVNAGGFEYEGRKAVLVFIHDITERKCSEAQRLASEMRYKALFESAGDAIFLMSGEIFIECNPRTLEIFRCKEGDIIGQPPYVFSPPQQPDGRDSKQAAQELIRRAFGGEQLSFDWLHSRCDGSVFQAEVTLTRLELQQEQLLLAIVRDITERRSQAPAG
jgi:PAS domain S-box-containing protein